MVRSRVGYVIDPQTSKLSVAYVIDDSPERRSKRPGSVTPNSSDSPGVLFSLIKWTLVLTAVGIVIGFALTTLLFAIVILSVIGIAALLIWVLRAGIRRLRRVLLWLATRGDPITKQPGRRRTARGHKRQRKK